MFKLVFINLYALLLFFTAVAMLLILFLLNGIYLKIIICFIALFFLTGSIIIFSKYTEKLEKIKKAINHYNKYGLDVEYFKYFLIDPCSILVLRYILFQVNEKGAIVKIKKNAINFNISEQIKI